MIDHSLTSIKKTEASLCKHKKESGTYSHFQLSSMKDLMENLITLTNLNENSCFFYAGAGLNFPCVAAACLSGCQTIGVECDSNRVAIGLTNILKWQKDNKSPFEKVKHFASCLLFGDVHDFRYLGDAVTHVYCYCANADVTDHVVNLFINACNCCCMILCQSPSSIKIDGIPMVKKQTMRMAGTRATRTAYIYLKNDLSTHKTLSNGGINAQGDHNASDVVRTWNKKNLASSSTFLSNEKTRLMNNGSRRNKVLHFASYGKDHIDFK